MVGRAVILGTGLALLVAAAPVIAQHHPLTQQRPVALVAEYDGIIHPIASEFLTTAIDQADTTGASVVLFILRTPGGLVDSTRAMVSRMITSRAPVVVYVAPSGARAASAGFILVLAADVAVMAPGTHIGAAHPVSGSGEKMDETMSKKATEDVAAYARSLAEARGRNVMLAEQAVTESRAFTDQEALHASPPLIDFVARDEADVLRQLDHRMVKRFDGRTTTVDTTGIEIRRVDMSWRQRALSAIAHPQIAYLLLTLGILGLTVELWTPGAILPGVVGGLCLLLAFFALQILPVNTIGLLLIVFGIAMLILELKVPSFGALGVGGAVALLIGSVMLTREVPGVSVSLYLIVPAVLTVAAIVLVLGKLALDAQRRPPVTGAEGLIGAEGRALSPIAPHAPGQVGVHGEIWRATSASPLDPGRPVRVRAVSGLTLHVEPADVPAREGGTA
jgi:membrane-bound serine protease (ClpP class)